MKQLRTEFPRLPVLMLSTCPDRQYAVRSLKLGAAGYLNKSADSAQLIEAIRRVAQGGLFINSSVAEQLASAVGAGTREDEPLHERLSQREYRAFRLLKPWLQRGRDCRAAGAVVQHRQHLPCAGAGENGRAQRCRAGAVGGAARHGARLKLG